MFEKLNRDIEDIKKKRLKLLELKSTMTQTKKYASWY